MNTSAARAVNAVTKDVTICRSARRRGPGDDALAPLPPLRTAPGVCDGLCRGLIGLLLYHRRARADPRQQNGPAIPPSTEPRRRPGSVSLRLLDLVRPLSQSIADPDHQYRHATA